MNIKNLFFLAFLTIMCTQLFAAAGDAPAQAMTPHDVLRTKPESKDLEYANETKGEFKLTPNKRIIKVTHQREQAIGKNEQNEIITKGIIEKTDDGLQREDFFLVDENVKTDELRLDYHINRDGNVLRSHFPCDVTTHYDENGTYTAFKEIQEDDPNFKRIIETKAADEDLIEVVYNDENGKPELNVDGKIIYHYYLVKEYVELSEELKGLKDTKKINSLNPPLKIEFDENGKLKHPKIFIPDPQRPQAPNQKPNPAPAPGVKPNPDQPNANLNKNNESCFIMRHKYKTVGLFGIISILSSLYHKHKKLCKRTKFGMQPETFVSFVKRTLKTALLNPVKSFDEQGNEAITIAVWSTLLAGTSCIAYDFISEWILNNNKT